MGLLCSDDLTDSLLEGVLNMHESATYQKILRDGRLTEAKRKLLRLGRKRFRDADAETVAAIEAIKDVDRLETLGERILDPEIHDWAALTANAMNHGPLFRRRDVSIGLGVLCRREIRRAVSDAQPPGPSEARSSSVFHLPPPSQESSMEESPVVHPSEKTLSFYGLGSSTTIKPRR